MKPEELEIVRRAYAKQVMAAARVDHARVEAAYAAVKREHFLGPGPWPILRWFRGYVPTPSDDPVYLYTDQVVGVLPERNLNNGEPSLHARLISSAAPQAGEHVVHVGAGVGYYTAILATLVGPGGAVTAIEFDPGLADRAAANFARWPNVQVIQGDGGQVPFDPADVIYVNAGATRPAPSWLDGLKRRRSADPAADDERRLPVEGARRNPAGRRNPATWRGLSHRAAGPRLLARWLSGVRIFPCEGARDEASETALSGAFATERWREVTRLYRRDDLPADQCWLRAPGWCLAYR